MPAYLIYKAWISDPQAYREYMRRTPAAIEALGGRFLARGGQSHTLEGEDDGARTFIVEFPSLDAARAFYDSARYREAMALRRDCAEVHMVIVDGAFDLDPGGSGPG